MIKSNVSVNKSEEAQKVDEKKPNGQSVSKGGGQNNNQSNIKNSSSRNNNQLLSDGVELIEDYFGKYYDDKGCLHNIKRFTWRNKNKIQVQVINYGARVVSIRMPDRRGAIHDIVLGFDDMAGYIHYKDKFFGATIGRMTSFVKNSTFVIDNKQHWLTPNHTPHHSNGGVKGFDQAVWTTFVEDKKVIMSHVSPHLTEGYPGDLLVRIYFELSAKNEFSIKMDAQCTQPTIVNLSNLMFFNLAGHYGGPHELYKHVLTMNCNCFTPFTEGMPSGAILNVVHSGFDFQIPKTLGKIMGIVPRDGFDQNLCVNRAMTQGDCFVARILHPPSGRMVEVYSNQPGVQLYTANEFGYNEIMSMEQLVKTPPPSMVSLRKCQGSGPLLKLYERKHKELDDPMFLEDEETFKLLYDLVKKIKDLDALELTLTQTESEDNTVEVGRFFSKHRTFVPCDFVFTQLQVMYLNNILDLLCECCDEDECEELREIVKLILTLAKISDMDEEEEGLEEEENLEAFMEEMPEGHMGSKEVVLNEKRKSVSSSMGRVNRKIKQNIIPEFYLSTKKILGKDRAHYRTHSGIALQTQNYPGCANYKNFPSCVLKPGETYTHTITYKFWIRAGNPNKWIKRNVKDS